MVWYVVHTAWVLLAPFAHAAWVLPAAPLQQLTTVKRSRNA